MEIENIGENSLLKITLKLPFLVGELPARLLP